MRTYSIPLFSLLACIVTVTTALHSKEPEVPDPVNSFDCALYTKPYRANEHGAYFLPAGMKWKVMPRYLGRTEDGKQIVDDRITLVLQDAKNSFWPVITKMSLEEAESLQKELSAIISEKKKATVEP